MSLSTSHLRSKLGRVKGLGAAHHGVAHWWWQRVTALALVPLSVWFVWAVLSHLLSPDPMQVAQWLASPVNSLAMTLFLIATFFHAKLGLQVVVEDYIKAPVIKYTLLLVIAFACIALPVVGIMAVLKLHFLDITSTSL